MQRSTAYGAAAMMSFRRQQSRKDGFAGDASTSTKAESTASEAVEAGGEAAEASIGETKVRAKLTGGAVF